MKPRPLSRREAIGLSIAVAGIIGGVLLEVFGSPLWGKDDAYISYRYALNFATGDGLVYNSGEYVEGYSNPLYVFLIAMGLLVVPSAHVFAFSTAINIVAGIVAVLMLYGLARSTLGRGASIAVAILFAWHPVFWKTTASGLETAWVMLLHLSLWWAAIGWARTGKRSLGAAVAAVIALEVWMRVDGFVFPFAAIGYLALQRQFRSAVVATAALVASVASVTLWRLAYYGEPLPNTYHNKVTGDMDARIAHAFKLLVDASLYEGFLLYVLVPASALVLMVVVALVRPRSIRHYGDMTFCVMAVTAAYWFLVGGDNLGLRFVLPLIPASLLAVFGVFRYYAWRPRWQLAAVALILLLNTVSHGLQARSLYPFEKRDGWVELGYHLRERHPGALLAIDAAGKVPYFSELRIVDMLGLTDAHIARVEPKAPFFLPGHMKWDGQYVLSRSPDLIAAYIFPNGDMPQVGIRAEEYLARGYLPKYLVSPSDHPPPLIVDIDDYPERTEAEWRELAETRFDYLVAVKRELIATAGSAPAGR